ncbi:MAG: hypothetical protein K2M10_07185, partial [Muribaculaceae bacterium]|nr:hypothetical protein [Muribaculaceae bacterium]
RCLEETDMASTVCILLDYTKRNFPDFKMSRKSVEYTLSKMSTSHPTAHTGPLQSGMQLQNYEKNSTQQIFLKI